MKTPILYLSLILLCFNSYSSSFASSLDSLFAKSKSYLFSNPQEANYLLSSILNEYVLEDSLMKAEILYNYGYSCSLLGSFDESIDAYYRVLKFSSDSESELNILANMQIAGVYSALGDYNKAFEYNDKALSYAKVIADSVLIASCHNNRGLIHYNLEEFSVADQSFLTALSINRRLGNIKAIAANLNNMCLYPGDSDKKLEYIDEAIVLNRNLNAHWAICENLNNRGKQLYYLGRYDEGIKELQTVQKMIKSMGAKELECDNYEYLSWLYAAKKDYKHAYLYLSAFRELFNELQSDHKLRNVERSLSSKEVLEKEQNLALIQHKLHISKLQRKVVILIIVVVVGIIILLFIPKWHRRKRALELAEASLLLEQSERELTELKLSKQQEQVADIKEDLNRLNCQLTSYALFIKNRNDILLTIQDRLKKTLRLSDSKMKGEFKSLILFIQQYRSNNSDDDILLQNIDEMSKSYMDRLMSLHPNLTKGEKKLAMLLRVNLSTKEIALLLGVNTTSVTMSKYRLKKSLNLDKDGDILTYLKSI